VMPLKAYCTLKDGGMGESVQKNGDRLTGQTKNV
jgi:hypothetical protein